MTKRYAAYLVLLSFTLILHACIAPEKRNSNEESYKNYTSENSKLKKIVLDSTSEVSYQKFYALPSPVQIASVLKKAGLVFQPGVICIEPFSKYASSVKKELMFGVYSADLSYCLLNGQRQLALDKFETLEKLSSDIGLDKVMKDELLIEEFKEKSQNLDSAIHVLSRLQEQTDIMMFEQDMEDRGVIIFSGAWVEGMYLASKASTLKKESILARRLIEQRTILSTLLRALNAINSENEQVLDLIESLESLKIIMDDARFLTPDPQGDGTTLSISDKDLVEISQKIQEIRKEVIS